MSDLKYFSKNGELLSSDQANIPLANIAYQYGFGVYENIKVRNNILYFVDQHIDRLFLSADVIGLRHEFTREDIKKYTQELVNKIESDSYNLKILLLGGKEPLLFIIPLAPYFPDRKLYSEGAKVITVKSERLFPQAKTLNMLASYLAYTKAKESDCYDSLLIDSSENIVEGTRTNFFAIKDNVIYSPPKEKILQGVTKMTVLYVAEKHGFVSEEKDIPLSAIDFYDGAFLTSTSSKIVPVTQIDEISLQIPEKLKELMRLYDAFLNESRGIFNN